MGVGATADLLLYSSHFAGQTSDVRHIRAGLNLEGRVAYVLPITGPLIIQANLRLGLVTLRQELSVRGASSPLFQSPWAYATLGISGGWVFR